MKTTNLMLITVLCGIIRFIFLKIGNRPETGAPLPKQEKIFSIQIMLKYFDNTFSS